MKRWIVLLALISVFVLGAYAVFAQPAQPPQRGMGGGMMGPGMGRGMMMQGGMGCPACGAGCGGMMQPSMVATDDGGVIVYVGGRLMRYNSELKKVSEANLDIDWTRMHEMAQQMMQNCPMYRQMAGQQQGQTAPQTP